MLARKKLADDLQKCTKAVVTAAAAVRKHSKVPIGEKTSEKATTPTSVVGSTMTAARRTG
jgi:hypothetical protein